MDLDSDAEEVIRTAVGGGTPGEFVGGLMAVRHADWDVGSAREGIEVKGRSHGMGR